MKTSHVMATAAAVVAAGCGSFEDPAIVRDFRVLAVSAEPTEYVIPFDPAAPPTPEDIELPPFFVEAVIADPRENRTIDWEMTICAADPDEGRCLADHPSQRFAAGTTVDPERGPIGNHTAVATYQPDANTYALLLDAIEQDPLGGFSGIDLQVQLRAVPTGLGEADAVYAAKKVRFAAQVPAARTPNQNPFVDRFDWDIGGDNPESRAMPYGRCAELGDPDFPQLMTIQLGEVLFLMPKEPDGVRETYLVPTFDGSSREFTENLSYQWLAGDGEWNAPFTGGPKDPFGNTPPLHAEWTPPDDFDGDSVDVPIWVIQRDERLGSRWYSSCVRVIRPL